MRTMLRPERQQECVGKQPALTNMRRGSVGGGAVYFFIHLAAQQLLNPLLFLTASCSPVTTTRPILSGGEEYAAVRCAVLRCRSWCDRH